MPWWRASLAARRRLRGGDDGHEIGNVGRRRFSVLDSVAEYVQGERDGPRHSFIPGGAVGEAAGQFRDLADPATIVLAVNLDGESVAHRAASIVAVPAEGARAQGAGAWTGGTASAVGPPGATRDPRGPELRATAAFDFIRALLAVPPSHSGQPWPWDDPPEPPDQVAPRDHALSLLWEAANAGPVYRYPADRTGWAVMRAVGRVDARAFWAELFRELDEAPHG